MKKQYKIYEGRLGQGGTDVGGHRFSSIEGKTKDGTFVLCFLDTESGIPRCLSKEDEREVFSLPEGLEISLFVEIMVL